MTGPGQAAFRETSAEPRVKSLPLAHLSLELGHLYMEDFAEGPARLRRHFAAVRPWVDAARASVTAARPRISTCFLIDDYFSRLATPAELVLPLLEAAEAAGLTVDYLARESACAAADPALRDGAPLARSVLDRLVESPPPGSNGYRPPVTRTGWLTNGRRAPGVRTSAALTTGDAWQPPAETLARGHSVFLDVELWNGMDGRDGVGGRDGAGGMGGRDGVGGTGGMGGGTGGVGGGTGGMGGPNGSGDRRLWSCAFLAAVWQLVRLGLLRDNGRPVLTPVPWDPSAFPADWDALPPVVRLNPRAADFTAYTTCSVLPPRFLPVEHAVRVVLDQVQIEPDVLKSVAERAEKEGAGVPAGVVDRVSYVFPPGL